MTPLVLAVAGVALVAAGWLVMRSLGPGVRVGRILAATPVVEMGQALAIATAGQARYVGVGGRVDAEEPWEDENGRPLVYQRSRLERREGSRWVAFEDDRRVVPFELAGALERIEVDGEALDEGLVVVTRESSGTAGEIPDRVPSDMPPGTPVRLRVEFVSAIDHALVLGVPVRDGERVVMRPGLGRPLVLTTLEPAEAMRLLASGRQTATRLIAVLFGAGILALVAGIGWAVIDALA